MAHFLYILRIRFFKCYIHVNGYEAETIEGSHTVAKAPELERGLSAVFSKAMGKATLHRKTHDLHLTLIFSNQRFSAEVIASLDFQTSHDYQHFLPLKAAKRLASSKDIATRAMTTRLSIQKARQACVFPHVSLGAYITVLLGKFPISLLRKRAFVDAYERNMNGTDSLCKSKEKSRWR